MCYYDTDLGCPAFDTSKVVSFSHNHLTPKIGVTTTPLFLRCKERAKHVGQCVLSASKWITPLEFERLGGKSAKKWKSSLFHGGRPLSDYNLLCTSAETPSAPITSDVAMQAESTMLIDVVLAFIKAFRL